MHGWEVETIHQDRTNIYLFRFLDDIVEYFIKEEHDEISRVTTYLDGEKIDKTLMVLELLKKFRS